MKLQFPSWYASNDGEFARYYNSVVFDEIWAKKEKMTDSYTWVYGKFNSVFNDVRRAVDQKMMQYLIEHGGVIDSWPKPFYGHMLELKQECIYVNDDGSYGVSYGAFDDDDKVVIRDVSQRFVYFGDDFGVVSNDKTTHTSTIGRMSSGLIFRHEYRIEDSPRYKELRNKTIYGRVSFLSLLLDEFKYQLRYVLGYVTALTAIFCILSLLGVDLTVAYENMWEYISVSPYKVLLIIAAIPVIAVAFIPLMIAILLQLLAASKGVGSLFIVLLIMAGASVVAYYLIADMMHMYHVKWSTIRKARAAAKKYMKSSEYVKAMEQEKEYEQLSEEWHRAWFEYLKSNWSVQL